MLGNDLARTEKFSTSLKDGLDIRETLRNWHTRELYVRVYPPTHGSLDCVVMLFDSPADPRDYPWRITWHAEHHDESTLSFFASDFTKDVVGPGIAAATYGGAMFLFPPRPIRDIWHDRRFDFTDTLEERLIAAGCYHSQERHVALLSAAPPGPGIRRLAQVPAEAHSPSFEPLQPGDNPAVADVSRPERPSESAASPRISFARRRATSGETRLREQRSAAGTLLRQAVECAQAPNDVGAVETDNFPRRKELRRGSLGHARRSGGCTSAEERRVLAM